MKTTLDLSQKTAIVTGGGSGIGRAIAQALAGNGAHVAILDFNEESGGQVSKEINEDKGSASFIPCDVTKGVSVEEAFQKATEGRSLDILINNAGIAHIGDVSTTTATDMDKVYAVNVRGVYHCLHHGVELMKKHGGSIVNLSSIAAVVGLSDRFAYSMSKGAVRAMTMSIAKDYIAHNIRCNCISPARIHTPFVDGFLAKYYPGQEKEMFDQLSKTQPIGRMGQPAEVGALVLYLCSEAASFITGSDIPIDGGFVTLNS